jgi:hypothetical protein
MMRSLAASLATNDTWSPSGQKGASRVMQRDSQKPPAQPSGRPPSTEQESRRAREAEALRANLKRRKEQSRARKASATIAPDQRLG